jgi:CheY-like chemotaxis protein
MSRIFVTEDDPDVRSSIAEILREEGFEVEEFCSAEETLCALRAGKRPCVVLMDLLMPEMNGQQFLDVLRADPGLAGIEVVMVTGARAALPGVDVLRKPFELADLISTVKRHCSASPGG